MAVKMGAAGLKQKSPSPRSEAQHACLNQKANLYKSAENAPVGTISQTAIVL
jgi:hypothetical protein